jgi:hypothetical protein
MKATLILSAAALYVSDVTTRGMHPIAKKTQPARGAPKTPSLT